MDNKKRNRLIISVSFTEAETEIYNHVKNKPNSSYYIKELVKNDIELSANSKADTVEEIEFDSISDMLF